MEDNRKNVVTWKSWTEDFKKQRTVNGVKCCWEVTKLGTKGHPLDLVTQESR